MLKDGFSSYTAHEYMYSCVAVVWVTVGWSQVLKFRTAAFTGGHKINSQAEMLKEGVDVAVCTPGRMKQLLEASKLSFELCQV